jgi:MoxR-like ATPase
MIAEQPQIDPGRATDLARRLEAELHKLIVGQHDLVGGAITALLANGHVLLEGVPGLGKTVLVRSLGEALALRFARIQSAPT